MELLRPDDAFFLYAETDDVHQHVGGLAVLDSPKRAMGPIRLFELQNRIEGQLGALPRFRQRLAFPPFALTRPVWVDAPDLDLARHVRLTPVPAPGGRRELESAVESIMSIALDRRHPLWEVYLLSGLEGGRQAILIKLHHAIADGLGALAVAARILDRDSPDAPSAPWLPRPVPRRWRLLVGGLVLQVAEPWLSVRLLLGELFRRPRRTLRRACRTAIGVWELARAGTAVRTSLNRSAGPTRRVALAEIPLDWVTAAQSRHGGTTNDVVLTAVAEALSVRFAEAGESVQTLRTMVPVAGRRASAASTPGSWTSTLSIDLPVGSMTLTERHRQVLLATRRAKRSHQPAGSRLVMNVVGRWAPAWLHKSFARWAYRGKWFNLIVSNLRGARGRRSCLGAPVVVAYPVVPLARQVALALAAMTWADCVAIGVTADAQVVPAVEGIAAGVVAAVCSLAGASAGDVGEAHTSND